MSDQGEPRDFADLTVDDILDVFQAEFMKKDPLNTAAVASWRESAAKNMTPERLAELRSYGRAKIAEHAEEQALLLRSTRRLGNRIIAALIAEVVGAALNSPPCPGCPDCRPERAN